MIQRNSHIASLPPTYLFSEINSRKKLFLEKNPIANLISLGIGDTTEPIPTSISEALKQAAIELGTVEGYTGYGLEQGLLALREKIAKEFYQGMVTPEEIFISDGAKCDLGRLQQFFGATPRVAVQDPAYPVYVDGSRLAGVTHIEKIACNPKNNFFPPISSLSNIDIFYLCCPNNPTGTILTKQQLQDIVAWAKREKVLIIFDSAYAFFIQDAELPRSIYEIPGAKEVAIEVSSFSKIAGFTGVRLGWTIVPKSLKFEDGSPVYNDWKRLTSTIFNGASNIVQKGALEIFSETGQRQIKDLIKFYMDNAKLLKQALESKGWTVYGGLHAPYLWVHFPNRLSWEIFEDFLQHYQLVVTPGSGFGSQGEGFIRISAFAHRKTIETAISRLMDQSKSASIC